MRRVIPARSSLVKICCAIVASAALGAAATGCGSSSSGGGSISAAKIQSAIDRTRQIHSLHVAEWLEVSSPQGFEHGTLGGDIDFSRSSGNAWVNLGGSRARTVFDGNTVWLSLNAPQFVQALPAGKRWVLSSVGTLESLGAFHPLGNSLALLDALRGVQTLSRTGRDSANFHFSLAQALERTPAARRAALEQAIHANGTGLVQTGSVALTPAGTVRSETLRIDGTGSESALHLAVSLDLSGEGESVTAEPPPPGQVVPLNAVPSLESELRSSAGAA